MRDTERTAEQKLKDRYKYQNEYIKSKYDRLALALPKGYKAIIDSRTKEKGFKNTTDYIKALIDQDSNNSNFQDFQEQETYNSFLDGSGLPFG